VDALELMFVLGGDEGSTSPGGVHVQPEVVFVAEVGDLVDGVKGPQDGGARGSQHHEGRGALGLGAQHLRLQVGETHASHLVHSHRVHVVRTQSEQGGHLLHRVVRVLGRQHHQAGQSAQTLRLKKYKMQI